MALTVGTDTYISQADCTTYLGTVYLSTDAKLVTWGTLTSDNKDVLLRKAAKIIDRQPLIGYKSTQTQAMEFPRITYTEGSPLDNTLFPFDEWYDPKTVPDGVKYAQCEIALELAQGTTTASERIELQRQGVKSFSLGKLSETYSGAANNLLSIEAKELLKPYVGGGFRIG
jgi:hypothetical protein